jgi:hypothetical protein
MTQTIEIARTIQQQIGGSALFMLGAKDLLAGENYLTFKIRGCKTVSHIRVTLEPTDTYKMEFIKVQMATVRRDHKVEVVAIETDVYAENLNALIEKHTGLATRL